MLFALPAIFVLVRALQLGAGRSAVLADALGPFGRTVLLASAVCVSACGLGTGLAWLTTRTDVAGRSLWQIVLILPLVLPSFVGAAAFQAALAPGGLLHAMLDLIGIATPRLRGFWPAWVLLTLLTYPYVLLPTSARLRSLRPTLEESARLLGSSPLRTFTSVTLPQIRSSILASGLLVFLYTVSEFGAVQLLGYDTLTRVIFATRLSDRATSFVSAAVLLALAVVVSGVERRTRRTDRVDDRARLREQTPVRLGRMMPIAVGFLSLVVLAGFVGPVASLAVWATRGLADGRVDVVDLLRPAANTTIAGVAASLVATVIVLPLAVMITRYRSPVGRLASVAVVGGFAVPGIVIALSLVFWTLNTPVVDRLYQTWPVLLFAYVLHFGSQALGASESAVRAVPDAVRESSQLLDPSPIVRLFRVDYPLMRPGLVSGAGLVLLSTVKELPATLLLSPIGFETLATKVWGSYEDGFYAEVGVASLFLIAVSAVLTWILVFRPIRSGETSL